MELRTDPNLTTLADPATMADVAAVHNAELDGATGAGVTVAVMDTGVDATHPVFDDVDVVHHDFTGAGDGDDVGHGTAIASAIARLAPAARILSLRVFGEAGRATMPPVARAYEWLTDNAAAVDLCNVSWGARSNDGGINRLHRAAQAAGVQDVVAAGNTGADGGSPATAPGAFSVGAVTETGELARFSPYDPDRDPPAVAAVGRNVRLARARATSLGRVLDDEWVAASGTSFSAAVTTGLAARYAARVGDGFVGSFESTARHVPGTHEDGEGILDYGRAIRTSPDPQTAGAMTWDFLGTDVVHIGADWFGSDTHTAVRVGERTVKLVPEDRV